MGINRKSRSFSTKRLLFLFVIIIVLFMYLLYTEQKIGSDNKWVSISEIQESDTLNSGYIYCNTYDNMQNNKTLILIFSFLLVCIVISLIVCILYLIKKLNKERKKIEKINFIPINKNEKNDQIVSKFLEDELEVKVQQILNQDFKNNIYNIFCNLQIACMNFDYKTLKNLLTQELYEKYCTGLENSKAKYRKNIVDDFEFISIKFIDINEDNNKHSIKVYLKVKYYGYIIDTNTNEIIKGIKDEKIVNTYMLNLIRYKDNSSKNCYSCGATLESDSIICHYCKTKNIIKSNDWIIAEKEKINEN